MAPNFMATASRLTQEQLILTGCSIESNDAAQMLEFSTLLQKARFTPSDARNHEVRRLVIIEYLDGNRLSIQLDADYHKDGQLPGAIDGNSIMAEQSFGIALWAWANTVSARANCGPSLDPYK